MHKTREQTDPSPDLNRNILLIILIAPPPLSIRKRNTNGLYWMQSLPISWPRLNNKTRKVCRVFFSVKSNSFPSGIRTTNPANLLASTISKILPPQHHHEQQPDQQHDQELEAAKWGSCKQNEQHTTEGEECQQAMPAQTQKDNERDSKVHFKKGSEVLST